MYFICRPGFRPEHIIMVGFCCNLTLKLPTERDNTKVAPQAFREQV